MELRASLQEQLVKVLPAKLVPARGPTLEAYLYGSKSKEAAASLLQALASAWGGLPPEVEELIAGRWWDVGSPALLAVVREIVSRPPPIAHSAQAMTRDTALKLIYELDPVEGRGLILRDLQNVRVEPSMDVIRLLPPAEIAVALPAAIGRVVKGDARELDYLLLDRSGDENALQDIGPAFEAQAGNLTCTGQAAMLRYFLRVAPEYGAAQVETALAARRTGCYRTLLGGLGPSLTRVEKVAILALDDPEAPVASNAALALGQWGTAEAEAPLFNRLRSLARTEYDAGSQWAVLESTLVGAIVRNPAWECGPEKFAILRDLVVTPQNRQWIQSMMPPRK